MRRSRQLLSLVLGVSIASSPALGQSPIEPPQDYDDVEPMVPHAPEEEPIEEGSNEPSAPPGLQSEPAPVQSVDPKVPASSPSGPDAPPEQLLALPTGADKSGVTSKSISVPKGSGTIQGMEESFSAQLSTGIATFSVPFSLPAARGGAQPSLGLSYSSSGGFGLAGVGWSIGVPFISRQTDRGVPSYEDQSGWHANQDRFVFNGGQELVPICLVKAGGVCTGAQVSEQMPVWASGWQYFRPRVEGSFLRFFWSPDHATWRVQDKSGVTMELGLPLDGSGYSNALERNPGKPTEVYRWHLVRQYDTWGSANPVSGPVTPRNVVVFRYFQDGGTAYLSDIYDTATASSPSAALAAYAHHTRLVYASRPDPTHSYRSGWRMEQNLRLGRLDVTSKTFNGGTSGQRVLLRRYHLGYDSSSHASLLASVQVEGRCTASEDGAQAEDASGLLPTTSCPRLPAMRFEYSHVTPYKSTGAPGTIDLPGYEGFDERLRAMPSSPPHSVDEEQTDLFDVNADSLPDVLVTATGLYGLGHGVFFQGQGGVPDTFGAAQPISVAGVLGADANTITLKNLNVAPLDLDGDGITDLLHMPKVKTYGVYGPRFSGTKWTWQGRAVTTSDGLSPKIDLGKDALDTQVMDVDFDGLVDVVVTTGTEVQTYFALGRFPNGDGRFGTAAWTGATSATLSTEPVRTCVPWSATPVRFSDSDIKTADMNGDGITDIVRVRQGDVRYWPGRGNGFWGTGKRDDCAAGTFGANRHVLMSTSPVFSDVNGESVRLDDVNGDGLTDMVQIRFDEVDVWLNVDGKGWTQRHIIDNTPPSPSFANRVRLADVNASGTRDLLWGNASAYQYMDLAGGSRPSVLVKVENGLGKSTKLEYSTSASEMLAAEKAGKSWATKMPTTVHVVKRVTESDNLTIAGAGPSSYVTEYTYRDPVYEGRQREFRGFRSASARRIGDANSPTDVTESTFLLGECLDEKPTNGIDECGVSERWRDNPRESLKGLPVITEKRSDVGVYLSTDVTRYRVQRLYTGLDGREVRHAYEVTSDQYLYDTASYTPQPTDITPVTVEVALAPPAAPDPSLSTTTKVSLRSTTGRVHLQSESGVDVFGNRTTAVAKGCVEALCPDGIDEIITTTTTPGRPAGDPTGWLWRTTESKVLGNQYFLGTLQQTYNVYSPEGALLTTQKSLGSTLPLTRSHATGGAFALPPSDVSPGGLITWTNTYDLFGNVTRESGPNGRCRDVHFETSYAQLPDSETLFVNGCDSTTPAPLTTGAAYDRSLAQVTMVVDIQSQPTQIAYDGFGRMTALTRPHPTTATALSPQPSVKLEYFLPTDLGSPINPTRYSILHTLTHDGTAIGDNEYLENWAYVDGFGRTLVTLSEADTTAGDTAAWIASGQVRYDGKGAVARKHLDSFYNGLPKAFPFGTLPTTPFGTQKYDSFGRQVETTDLDGTVTLKSFYHALSTDLWDAADLSASHTAQGTYATERKDGHGRAVAAVERFRVAGVMNERETKTRFLPTGEPLTITRTLLGTSSQVMRWMRYDSLGRMLVNVEPNASMAFTTDYTSLPASLKTWRYAYNDAGDLVGTSDARGCGVNFKYDGAGRLFHEDYSPCTGDHVLYSTPNTSVWTGVEVYYHYDTDPNIITDDTPLNYFTGTPSAFLKGRLVAVFDKASITVSKYDGRGRGIGNARRLAKPGIFDSSFATRYAARWYQKTTAYDGADRETSTTTGATVAELLAGGSSTVTTSYSKRGTAKSASGSYGTLVASTVRAADGLMTQLTYGDAASTATAFTYDTRRRLATAQTVRAAPSLWSAPPGNYLPAPTYPTILPSHQLVLQDDAVTYDEVSNPTAIDDYRVVSQWPAEAQPVHRQFVYDDFYRLTQVEYRYDGSSRWTSPFDAENNGAADPRLGAPVPHVSYDDRPRWQTYAYDWLGNTSSTDDDVKGFYERSLGTITNSTTKPYQLTSASNEATPGSPIGREGNVATAYDATGNLTRLHLRRAGTCLGGANCNQIFDYQWDEVGRLVRARRWDVTPANLGTPASLLPGTAASADLTYTYDASDERVIKQAIGATTRSTAYIFDSLELHRSELIANEYTLSKWTEVPYLFVNGVRVGRVHYNDASPELAANETHVLLELGDHLGSTSIVIDKVTGELVERGTWQAYGAKETDYRTSRWQQFREDYGFTGKEEDVQVGLTYFGKRFLSPYLNRWVSADPLAVHVPGEADLNVYAYVSGQALKAIDPLGLEGKHGESGPGNVPVAKDEQLEPNEVGHGGGTQAAPEFTEEELFIAACAATAGTACTAFGVGSDSSGRKDLEVDPKLAVPALMTVAGGRPGGKSTPGKAPVDGPVKRGASKIGGKAKDTAKVGKSAGAMRNPFSGGLVKVPKPDAQADLLAKRIGGTSRVKFSADPKGREFDVVSDDFVGQTTSRTQINKKWRAEAKATFEAADLSGKTPYFHFQKAPNRDMLRALERYAEDWGVSPVIDLDPL
jgi:RHS repeat-associated protein